MTQKISIAILGASGYTGAELIRLLLGHPHARIAALTGDSQAGKSIGEVYPHLHSAGLPDLVAIDEVDFTSVDVVFCCLPHATTQPVIAKLPDHVTVIDLSADFRLKDPAAYEEWYGHAHQAVALQKEAVYGLSEVARESIKNARLIANPGCYPTSAQLPLIPLLGMKIIKQDAIIIDAKSGVTGAGRAAKQANLYAEITDGMKAYGVAAHRHTPEIEQGLSEAAGSKVEITFTPHLIPMSRGIFSTIYVRLAEGKTVQDIRNAWQNAYGNEPFIELLAPGILPTTHQVKGTNLCAMQVVEDRIEGKAIILSVIDNLVKGAAGQAVQNMNIRFGWDEKLGLQATALFP